MTDTDVKHPPRQSSPVQVEIKNWSDNDVKPRLIKNTVHKTFVLDPGTPSLKLFQICGYEPHRVRLHVHPIDHEIGITTENPRTNEVPYAASPLVGYSDIRYLPVNGASPGANGYDFYGPDAHWIVSVGAVTRVGVTKEYS